MDITYLDENGFVRARYSGPWTVDELLGTAEPVLAECLKRKKDLLLLDWSELSPRPISTLDRYRMGSSALIFSKKLAKVATLVPATMIDPEKFGQQVARNRGLNVRTFSDPDEACQWLLQKGQGEGFTQKGDSFGFEPREELDSTIWLGKQPQNYAAMSGAVESGESTGSRPDPSENITRFQGGRI